jgi:hypothetical protein
MSNLVARRTDVIEIPVTPEMLKFAQENSHKGTMNRHSLLEGAQNVEGLLAELAVLKYLPMLTHKPTDEYDFTFPLKEGLLTIDVKNKFDVKRYGGIPGLDWDCTIFGYEAKKKCHLYLFTSTNGDNSKVFLKGYIGKKAFVCEERLYRAGATRTTTQGSVTYKKDNYVIQVKEMIRVDVLKARLIEIAKQLQAERCPHPQATP